MKTTLLKILRMVGRPLKARGVANGSSYLITITGKKRVAYLQLFVFYK